MAALTMSQISSSEIASTTLTASSLPLDTSTTQTSSPASPPSTSGETSTFQPPIPTFTDVSTTQTDNSPTGSNIDVSTILSATVTSSEEPEATSIVSPTASPTIGPGIVNCQQQRPEGGPSGSQVANALSSEEQVATFCGANFDTGDPLTQNFYHGSMQIQVHRGYDTEALSYCTEGLDAIIDACIRNGPDFGGSYTRGDQQYSISNLIFPNNPLQVGDDGGPPPPGITTCFDDRPSDAPTGDQIANALTQHLGLETMCTTSFTTLNPLSITFNHQYVFITLERGYDTEPLTYCLWGLNAILDNCIRYNNFYGGRYTQGDQIYTILNHIYPANPLSPYDDGGPPAPTPTPIPPIPIDPGAAPGCIETSVLDIPLSYILTDGRQSLRNLIYRLRASSCQNLCDATSIAGAPPHSAVATRFGTTGCELAIRITDTLELYLYSTSPGQNCYDATDKIINTCIPTYRQGWIGGPNAGEFYQLGTRAANAPTAVHPPVQWNQWVPLPHTIIELDFIPEVWTLLHVWGWWSLGLSGDGRELREALEACFPLTRWEAGVDPDTTWDFLVQFDWKVDSGHCSARAVERVLGLPWGFVTTL